MIWREKVECTQIGLAVSILHTLFHLPFSVFLPVSLFTVQFLLYCLVRAKILDSQYRLVLECVIVYSYDMLELFISVDITKEFLNVMEKADPKLKKHMQGLMAGLKVVLLVLQLFPYVPFTLIPVS